MQATIRLVPCSVCQHDPAFGTIHLGCSHCKRVKAERETQPNLILISTDPLIYEEKLSK